MSKLLYLSSFRFLPIIDRYLLKQFLSPFILAVAGFVIIGIIDILFYLVELVVRSGVSPLVVLRLLVYKLPSVMVLFFPMAVLFATMLVFVRMAKDNELTVLRTSGVHAFRIMIPIILLTLLISFFSYVINESIVPWTNKASDQLIQQQLKKTPPPNIEADKVFKDADRYFYVKRIQKDTNQMQSILMIEETVKFPRVVTAKSGDWNDFKWTLYDGYIQEFTDDGDIKFMDHFDEMKINVDQNIRSYYRKHKKPKEMDSSELKEKINLIEDKGGNTQTLEVELHLKKSIPFMCFVFSFMGIAYCFSYVKTGKDWWGVILSICVAVLSVGFYFFLLALCRAFAQEGYLDTFIGAWLPNIIYLVISSSMVFYQCKYR